MFNSRLKKELQTQGSELFMLRQLHSGMEGEMLSMTIDPEYRVTSFNDECLKVLGYPAAQLQGKPLDDLVPEYVKQMPCYNNLRNAVNRGEHVSDRYRFIRADGGLAWLR